MPKNMKIYPVDSRSDLQKFIEFPYMLYKNDPIWVPPLKSELKKQFSPKHNPFLRHCEWQLFLLKDNGKIIGRIAAFVDNLAMDFWKERIGLFGYFECVNDETASSLLIEAAKNWLLEKQCTSMRGPWSFVTQEWGMVVEGFKPSPVVMSPYNPPYYNGLVTSFGLKKVKDLLCWSVSITDGYKIPQRILKLTDSVKKRYDVRIRQIDMKRYEEEVQIFIELSNSTLTDNWGYSPVTDAEANAMASDMKTIMQSKGVLFAEDKNGRPIGFAVALPDINALLKGMNGRLLPFGFLKLLRGIPRLKQYRMFALGVIPEYQGKAVDSLLYRALNESLHSEDLYVEINYVLEDNWPMVNAINKLGATPLRRYRVYEMGIG
jgi:ribosomal protein S18 acetylase RimI-like enzyme